MALVSFENECRRSATPPALGAVRRGARFVQSRLPGCGARTAPPPSAGAARMVYNGGHRVVGGPAQPHLTP
eukprot:CAMPEP_0206017870 /NCGR_PEP_ID=MMETSP1464-20131121/25918_1 /ASSEMBLY_ACC=CAM_ASM_001124 /TAXON_ID=119497 /ORGANISM="Exanthemachrysis gayraliae, Strain RCC1523" /LENGTH=70 /DNA_ID=CAMNT_0053391725 /DNA_START=82 /DNA_END=291 /DNA_ORIENTATION=-